MKTMLYKKFNGIEKQASTLVTGTMYLYNGAEEDGFRFLDMSVGMGITVFDSAQSYGQSEVVLGK